VETQNIDKDEILSENKEADKVETDDSSTLSEDEIQKILSGNNEEADAQSSIDSKADDSADFSEDEIQKILAGNNEEADAQGSVEIEADNQAVTDGKEEIEDTIDNKSDEAEDVKDDFVLLDEEEVEEFGFEKDEENNESTEHEDKTDDREDDNKDATSPNELIKEDSPNKKPDKKPDKKTDEKADKENVKPGQLKSEKNIHSADERKKNSFFKKKGIKNKYLILIFSGVFIFVCLILSGWFFYYKDIKKTDKPYEKEYENNNLKEFKEAAPLFFDNSADEKTYAPVNSEISLDKINISLEKAKGLRNELLKKQEEINELIGLYMEDIDKIQNEIKLEIDKKNINSYEQAVNNDKIRLGLLMIQRNQAYIDKLADPLEYLNRGSEELLYIEHQTRNDIQMYRIINSIKPDEIQKRITDVISNNYSKFDKLAVDMKDVKKLPLENIWKDVNALKNKKKVKDAGGFKKKYNNNEVLDEISKGNFRRKNELTYLTPKVSEALSKWKGRELFLNSLTGLLPEDAKKLAKWEGNWLCLNGLKRLSPESAKYLFQWNGKILSLNGITELDFKITQYLSQWNGSQLELIGLIKITPKVAKHLTNFEKSGGKVYLPGKFRRKD